MPVSLGQSLGEFSTERDLESLLRKKNLHWRSRHAPTGGEITGTGSMAISKPGISGAGTQYISGTGSFTAHAPIISGEGGQPIEGSGGVSFPVPAILPIISGSGDIAIQKPAISGSGPLTVTGTGGVAITKPAISGAGGQPIEGTGSIEISVPAIEGIGGEEDMILSASVSQFDSDTTGGTANTYGSSSVAVHLTDGRYTCVWNGSGWDYYFGTHKVVRPSDASFSWINQNGASISSAAGFPIMTYPASAGRCIRKKSAPATPYTITAFFLCNLRAASSNYPAIGLVLRKSSDGSIRDLKVYNNSSGGTYSMALQDATSATAAGSDVTGQYDQMQLTFQRQQLIGLQITDNGTNNIAKFSGDGGLSWIQYYSGTRKSGVDEIGWEADGNQDFIASLVSWDVS